jgi:hypothetical protein
MKHGFQTNVVTISIVSFSDIFILLLHGTVECGASSKFALIALISRLS